jgi:hypothetical protein
MRVRRGGGRYPAPERILAESCAGVGDFMRACVRQDLSYKVLDQGMVTDDTGKVVYNLPPQDMLGLAVVGRNAYVSCVAVTHAALARA